MTLVVDRLSVTIGNRHVLRDVSLHFSPAATTAVLGPPGAGKGALLRAIIGTEAPSAGTILLFGADISCDPPARRAQAGLGYAPPPGRDVEQLTLINPWDGVTADAATGLSPSDRRRHEELVRAILPETFVPLAESGAMADGGRALHRLAGALLTGTRFLLLDDPFQGLAAEEILRYGAALADLREMRPELGIVLTAGNDHLGEIIARHLADHIVHLRDGTADDADACRPRRPAA